VSVVLFKFLCNILISSKIIKEIPGSVASGTCTLGTKSVTNVKNFILNEVIPLCIYIFTLLL